MSVSGLFYKNLVASFVSNVWAFIAITVNFLNQNWLTNVNGKREKGLISDEFLSRLHNKSKRKRQIGLQNMKLKGA